jgi:anti-anti-sigma regulatory factor
MGHDPLEGIDEQVDGEDQFSNVVGANTKTVAAGGSSVSDVTDVTKSHPDPTPVHTCSFEEFTDAEYTALLDTLDDDRQKLNEKIAIEEKSDLITDAEFDKMLDGLHGNGKITGIHGESADSATSTISSGDEHLFVLEKDIDISKVSSLHAELRPWLEENRDLLFEASHIQSIDTAALQLLFSFVREARARGAAVHWRQPSEAMIKTAGLLDLQEHLDLRVVEDMGRN